MQILYKNSYNFPSPKGPLPPAPPPNPSLISMLNITAILHFLCRWWQMGAGLYMMPVMLPVGMLTWNICQIFRTWEWEWYGFMVCCQVPVMGCLQIRRTQEESVAGRNYLGSKWHVSAHIVDHSMMALHTKLVCSEIKKKMKWCSYLHRWLAIHIIVSFRKWVHVTKDWMFSAVVDNACSLCSTLILSPNCTLTNFRGFLVI